MASDPSAAPSFEELKRDLEQKCVELDAYKSNTRMLANTVKQLSAQKSQLEAQLAQVADRDRTPSGSGDSDASNSSIATKAATTPEDFHEEWFAKGLIDKCDKLSEEKKLLEAAAVVKDERIAFLEEKESENHRLTAELASLKEANSRLTAKMDVPPLTEAAWTLREDELKSSFEAKITDLNHTLLVYEADAIEKLKHQEALENEVSELRASNEKHAAEIIELEAHFQSLTTSMVCDEDRVRAAERELKEVRVQAAKEIQAREESLRSAERTIGELQAASGASMSESAELRCLMAENSRLKEAVGAGAEELEKKVSALKAITASLARLGAFARELSTEHAFLKERAQKKLDVHRVALAKIQTSQVSLVKHVHDLQKQVGALQKTIVEQVKLKKTATTQLDDTTKELTEARALIETITRDCNNERQKALDFGSQCGELTKKLEKSKAEVEKVKMKLEKAKAAGAGSSTAATVQKAVAEATAGANDECSKLRSALSKANDEVDTLRRQKQSEMSASIESYNEVVEAKERANAAEDRVKELTMKLVEAEKGNERVAQVEKELDETQRRLKQQSRKQPVDTEQQQKRMQQMTVELINLRAEVDEKWSKVIEAERKTRVAETELATANARVAELVQATQCAGNYVQKVESLTAVLAIQRADYEQLKREEKKTKEEGERLKLLMNSLKEHNKNSQLETIDLRRVVESLNEQLQRAMIQNLQLQQQRSPPTSSHARSPPLPTLSPSVVGASASSSGTDDGGGEKAVDVLAGHVFAQMAKDRLQLVATEHRYAVGYNAMKELLEKANDELALLKGREARANMLERRCEVLEKAFDEILEQMASLPGGDRDDGDDSGFAFEQRASTS